MKTCLIDNCGKPVKARGWCAAHWWRWRQHGDPAGSVFGTSEERFWAKVDKAGPTPDARPDLGNCWLWLGWRNDRGYGSFFDGGKDIRAHHFLTGHPPDGFVSDHLCRVTSCVRPSHLEFVTISENTRRGLSSALRPPLTHCLRGHEYTEANTLYVRGQKRCRACSRERNRNRRIEELLS